jgi:hypothetical protein
VEELDGQLRKMGVRVVLKPFDLETLLTAVREGLAEASAPGETTGHEG